ncbi:MAG TPA: S8 family serine peptidase [Methanospirillum sp.]|nr:S8 family serine peptidase [Methanospirillum sp.]
MRYLSILLFVSIVMILTQPGAAAVVPALPVIAEKPQTLQPQAAITILPPVQPPRETSSTSSQIGIGVPSAVPPLVQNQGSDLRRQTVQSPRITTPINQTRTNSTVVNTTTSRRDLIKPVNGTYVPGEVIVRYNLDNTVQTQSVADINTKVAQESGVSVLQDLSSSSLPGIQLMKLPANLSVEEGISILQQNPQVMYAEPNYLITLNDPPGLKDAASISEVTMQTPNDPYFSDLWGLQSGSDHDIDAPEAWDLSTGSSSVIVAVVDTGVNYNHNDLSANIWTNPGETPDNGIDDDGNVYVDDVYGYDFCNMDKDPMDDRWHGTHCAGTIGAVGNNGRGVVGVNWNVKIMSLKFLNSAGTGTTDRAILAINYANDKGASVISNSWGGGDFSQGLWDAIDASPAVVICAAGNDGVGSADYPAGYDCSNIISVAASDSSDNRASFTNYNAVTVDVAAPGVSILSTYKDNQYAWADGTSMATPHVAGLAALIKARNPNLTKSEIKQIILDTVDKLSQWNGYVLTGGRINAYSALVRAKVPLQARFYGVPGVTVLPYTVQFYDASLGSPTTWLWDFGDNSTSSLQNPLKEYTKAGSYTVRLTVSRPD